MDIEKTVNISSKNVNKQKQGVILNLNLGQVKIYKLLLVYTFLT